MMAYLVFCTVMALIIGFTVKTNDSQTIGNLILFSYFPVLNVIFFMVFFHELTDNLRSKNGN